MLPQTQLHSVTFRHKQSPAPSLKVSLKLDESFYLSI